MSSLVNSFIKLVFYWAPTKFQPSVRRKKKNNNNIKYKSYSACLHRDLSLKREADTNQIILMDM